MTTQFFKMTGSGNDFVMLDGRKSSVGDWTTERIVAACDRRTGIGADGLVILEPDGDASVRMHFYNADGSRAAMCGNAALCSSVLAHRLAMAPDAFTLATDAGPVSALVCGESSASISLPPVAALVQLPGIEPLRGEHGAWLTTVGVPHLVVLVDDIEAVDIDARGRELRFHPTVGPAGANANFIASPASPGGRWLIRTYERGVEGETLACGTGTVAAGLFLHQQGIASLPASFLSRGGFPLEVEGTPLAGGYEEVRLSGEGRVVFQGQYPA